MLAHACAQPLWWFPAQRQLRGPAAQQAVAPLHCSVSLACRCRTRWTCREFQQICQRVCLAEHQVCAVPAACPELRCCHSMGAPQSEQQVLLSSRQCLASIPSFDAVMDAGHLIQITKSHNKEDTL